MCKSNIRIHVSARKEKTHKSRQSLQHRHTQARKDTRVPAGQMHWEIGTVWEPWSCSCSADARCPISYSQCGTKQNYSTLAAANTQARTNVCTYTHSVVRLRQREEGNNNVPFNTRRSMINLRDNKKTQRAEHLVLQLTFQVECFERCGQISIYAPTLFFAIIMVLFLVLVQCDPRKASCTGQERGSLPSSLAEADLSHEVTYITSVLLRRNKLRKTHKKKSHAKDTWRSKQGMTTTTLSSLQSKNIVIIALSL